MVINYTARTDWKLLSTRAINIHASSPFLTCCDAFSCSICSEMNNRFGEESKRQQEDETASLKSATQYAINEELAEIVDAESASRKNIKYLFIKYITIRIRFMIFWAAV